MINEKCSKDPGVYLGDGGDLAILGIWVRVLKHLREKQGSHADTIFEHQWFSTWLLSNDNHIQC